MSESSDNAVESVSILKLVEAALGLVALILAIVVVFQAEANKSLASSFAASQARVAKGRALVNLDNSLVQAVAHAAVDNNDVRMRDLLTENGVTIQGKPAEAGPAAP